MSAFDQAFLIVVGEEGGYTADPADPGNWTGGGQGLGVCRGTKYGISAASYPLVNIAMLTLDNAKAIYRRDYWGRVAGDALPPIIALITFDAAVNSGVGRAARWLQAAAGVAEDGAIGPVTLAAVQSKEPDALAAECLAQRLYFITTLPTWPTFGVGWARRLTALPFKAMEMVA